MCIDLKNHYQKEEVELSGWKAVLVTTLVIVTLFVLIAACLKLLPNAIDQFYGISAPSGHSKDYSFRLEGEHQYHPTTHEWTFVGHGK